MPVVEIVIANMLLTNPAWSVEVDFPASELMTANPSLNKSDSCIGKKKVWATTAARPAS